jgi:uncharacterized membrane protein
VFKANDSDLYAYLLTSALLAFNLMSLHLGYNILSDPGGEINTLWSIVLIGASLLIVYLVVMRNGKQNSISKDSFPKYLQGKLGGLLAILYFLFSIFIVIFIASIGRQYYLN